MFRVPPEQLHMHIRKRFAIPREALPPTRRRKRFARNREALPDVHVQLLGRHTKHSRSKSVIETTWFVVVFVEQEWRAEERRVGRGGRVESAEQEEKDDVET